MSIHRCAPSRSDFTIAILGFLAILLILAVLSEFTIPLVADIRHATLALGVIGFVMCLVGGIPSTIRTNGWTSPAAAFGIILGVVALLLVGSALFQFKLPLIESDRTAFLVLALLTAVKVMILDVPWDRFTA